MKIDWWLTGICFGRALSQTVTMVYAAALPVLQREWEMSAAKAGAISSGYQISYAISLLVISSLADRIGARFLFIISMLSGAVFTTAFAFFARGYVSALVLYSLVALAIGGSYTTGLMLLSEHYPPHRRGLATGFYIASSSLAYVLSLSMSGLTIPAGGYKLSFFVTCLATLLGGILSWITLAKTRETVVARQRQQSFRKEVLSNKPAMLYMGVYTFHCWELLGMWAWAPAFMTACLMAQGAEGLNAAGMGAYITAGFHLSGLVASFSMGSLSDRLGRARVILVLAGLSTLCSFAIRRDCCSRGCLQFYLSRRFSRAFRRSDGSGHPLLPGRGLRIEILARFRSRGHLSGGLRGDPGLDKSAGRRANLLRELGMGVCQSRRAGLCGNLGSRQAEKKLVFGAGIRGI
jgi:nitrate/nitrite transporter NarK